MHAWIWTSASWLRTISRLFRSQHENRICYGQAYPENLLLPFGHQAKEHTHLGLLIQLRPHSDVLSCLVEGRQFHEERNANI